MPESEQSVNQVTFRTRVFYLYLAKDEAEDPEQRQENERTDDHQPMRLTGFDQAAVEIPIEREETAIAVGTQRVAAGEIDERRHQEQAEQQRETEGHRFERQSRLREVVPARTRKPVEQFELSPRGVRRAAGKR